METADSAGFWTDWDAKLANQRQVLNLHLNRPPGQILAAESVPPPRFLTPPSGLAGADSAKLPVSLAHSPHQLTWQQSYPACLLSSTSTKLLPATQSADSSTSTKLLPIETSDREPTPKHQQSYSP
ncbi:unnamed protein product [Sphagnum jensenii]|uniref:Uncharacterized protein n=1 Tax=Sphagnum jensenii TaxID=128206 RepID=A0ABP0ZZ02_9BRYO